MAVGLANATLVPASFQISGKAQVQRVPWGTLLVLGGVTYLLLAPKFHLPGAALVERIEGVSPPGTATPSSPSAAAPPATTPTPAPVPTAAPATGLPAVTLPATPTPATNVSPYPVAFLVADQADYVDATQAGVPPNALYYLGTDPVAGQSGQGYGPPTFLPTYTGQVGQPAQTVVIGVAARLQQGSLATLQGANRQVTLTLLKQFLANNPWTIQPGGGSRG
jgi:hypothetical protein